MFGSVAKDLWPNRRPFGPGPKDHLGPGWPRAIWAWTQGPFGPRVAQCHLELGRSSRSGRVHAPFVTVRTHDTIITIILIFWVTESIRGVATVSTMSLTLHKYNKCSAYVQVSDHPMPIVSWPAVGRLWQGRKPRSLFIERTEGSFLIQLICNSAHF